MRVEKLNSIKIKIASPEDILSWSHGEITKPETINYRTQRPEKDGLFCEKIFGPTKDYECYCGKYRRIRYKGIVCDRCGVEVARASVRRERMGHIKLAIPCAHIWFLRGVPSRIGLILDVPMPKLEKIIYFAAFIITRVDEEAKKATLKEIEAEYKQKVKSLKVSAASPTGHQKGKTPKAEIKNKKKLKTALKELEDARNLAEEELKLITPLRILSELEYQDLSLKYGEIFDAGTGAETLRKIFERINFKEEIKKLKKRTEKTTSITKKKILRRLKLYQAMEKEGIRPEWMFLTILPVLPPDLRPMVQLDGGRFASSDLNDLYRRVINRNNRLKYLLEIKAPEVILRNEKRMLQEAVDALLDNGMRRGITTRATTGGRRLLKSLADMLKGKQGRFRQNLLGKRVDYSGRSVIVVGPELKLNQAGLPKKMALELFKPFVISKILERELAYNVRGASRLIEEEVEEVWAILEEVVKDKLVLINRAPTLHRLGIQAFYPVLIEGEAIRIHPLICKAFNADFDGDQMAVHVPLSVTAQKESSNVMLSNLNLLKPATGTPIVSPTKDIVLGCYHLTRLKEGAKGEGKIFANPKDAELAYEFGEVGLKAKVKIRINSKLVETSVGRVIFNDALPEKHEFINETVDSKRLEKLVSDIISNSGREIAVSSLDEIKDLGFKYSTTSGITWGIDDLIVPKEKEQLIQEAEREIEKISDHYKKGFLSKEEKYLKAIEVWQKTKSDLEKLVPEVLPKEGSVFSIVDSGARGSWLQPVQMSGMKGLVVNPVGEIIELPVKSSFKEGFNVLEYFISTHGARKGTVDTALRTSSAGYLTRRLVDVAHEVLIFEKDCKDQKGIDLFRADADVIGQNFAFKLLGRVILEDVKEGRKIIVKKGDFIDWEKAEKIIESKIEKVTVRSPLSCKSTRGICQKCYGWDLGRNQLIRLGEAVGIVAAQAIGEPGTQLTMRTFHTGGVAGGGDITMGLPRVEEIFERRPPKGEADLSVVDGKVLEIKENVIKIKGRDQNPKERIFEYHFSTGITLWVKKGDRVEKGQQLFEGNLDLRDLFKLKGKNETQRYIISEIQKIYVSQGAVIHDKHIEVIIRQMLSRVRIKEPGDSSFTPGEVVEKSLFLEENKKLKEKTKAKAKQILLGISRVALTTDSFLSAASFQETSRVLIKAALEGKEDKLRGLKENVIIGKLIPAGTGFKE